MKSEALQQNNMEKPDINNWAALPSAYCQWVRIVGPQFGIDGNKPVLGKALECIAGDDGNCFAWNMGGFIFNEERATQSKNDYLIRLNWEINTPEIPEKIKERLRVVQKEVDELDWNQLEEFNKAKKAWTNLQSFVKEEVKKDGILYEAQKYVDPTSKLLNEYWSNFIK